MTRARDAADLSTGIDVDSSGNVGIGTSSPDALLTVKGQTVIGGSVAGSANLSNLTSGTPPQLIAGWSVPAIAWSPSASTEAVFTRDGNMQIDILAGANDFSNLNFSDPDDEDVGQIAYDHSVDSMRFRTDNVERMRINSSGNLLIKTTGPAIPVSALAAGSVEAVGASANNVFKAKVTTSAYIAYASQGPTSGAAPFYYHSYMLNGSNTAAGHITVNNTSTSYSTSSDYRLKTDAQPMTGASARVQALNPVNFEWIADGTRVDGFLAHEAQEVVPECATGTKDAMRDEEYEVTAAVEATYDDDGNELTPAVDAVMGTRSVPDYQGIDQSKLVPLLTAALQEALTKIDDLETRLAALEAV